MDARHAVHRLDCRAQETQTPTMMTTARQAAESAAKRTVHLPEVCAPVVVVGAERWGGTSQWAVEARVPCTAYRLARAEQRAAVPVEERPHMEKEPWLCSACTVYRRAQL